MITLTFGNIWPEYLETIKNIKFEVEELRDSNFGITYCGIESMFIFEERLSKIKDKKFENFLTYCNLPKCKNFVCRLEFQNRGAPHVHILMWLEKRISLDEIKSHFYAHIPPVECEFINSVVKSQMVHSCVFPRCFTGKNKDKCTVSQIMYQQKQLILMGHLFMKEILTKVILLNIIQPF